MEAALWGGFLFAKPFVAYARHPQLGLWSRLDLTVTIPNYEKLTNIITRNLIMLITTTNTIEGRRILDYKGMVNGEAILGANVFKDFFAGIRDIVGGRSGAYESELQRARDIAVMEMKDYAQRLGANAIIGVDVDYETVGERGSMLMVAASGTAVVIE